MLASFFRDCTLSRMHLREARSIATAWLFSRPGRRRAFSERRAVALIGLVVAGSSLLASPLTVPETVGEIERMEARLKTRPEDFIAFAMLGQLRLRRVRETGNFHEYEKAADAFDSALAIFPDHSPALGGLAAVRLALHRFGEAAELAQQILRRDPASVDGALLLSDAQMAMGDRDSAEQTCARLGEFPAVWLRRAEFARGRGDDKKAEQLFLRAAEGAEARGDSAENVSWYRVRAGEMFFRHGDFDEAERQYEMAIKAWPQSFQAAERVAELRAAQRRFDEAIVLYRELAARSERPDLAQALGDIYLLARQPAEAKMWHDRALAGYLDSAGRGELYYLHHLAGFYADVAGNGEAAVKWARQDLVSRQSPIAHDGLAWALYRAGNFAESRREIEHALAANVKDAHLIYHAGLIFSAAGDLERGQQFMREAAALNPHYADFHIHR